MRDIRIVLFGRLRCGVIVEIVFVSVLLACLVDRVFERTDRIIPGRVEARDVVGVLGHGRQWVEPRFGPERVHHTVVIRRRGKGNSFLLIHVR